ncbi:MAG: PQQ-binding-like beta-propeller repeat protein [Phycisphaerae bacterium]
MHGKKYLLALLCSFGMVTVATSGDWPNFRGPNHDGIATETGFKKKFDGKIPQVWSRDVGSAFSSFAVVGDKLFTGGTKGGMQTLVCLNATDGSEIWTVEIEPEYKEPQGGDGPRATPTVDGGKVYMLGAKGKLICVLAENGDEVWSKQFNNMPTWGYSGSVLIDGERAIVSAGKEQGGLVAYDKNTGEKIWQASDDIAGYATPYPFDFEGTRYVAGFLGNSAIVVNADDGEEAWGTRWQTMFSVNAAAPIFHEGQLFLSSGYRHGCALYDLRKKSDGTLEAREVWDSKMLRNKFQSAMLIDGALYSGDEKGIQCVDFATGKRIWTVPRKQHSTMLAADDHLIVLTEDGELMITPISKRGFDPVTKQKVLDDRCWTVPVLANGKLYVRNLTKVVCLDLME